VHRSVYLIGKLIKQYFKEIYVQFAGIFKGDRFSGWYMGGFQRSKYDPRFQCSGDFTLVSDEIKEQKAVLSV